MSLPANLSETTQDHLRQLVEESTPEGARLDFKRELPTQWDNKRKESFVADITAFANAGAGGLSRDRLTFLVTGWGGAAAHGFVTIRQ